MRVPWRKRRVRRRKERWLRKRRSSPGVLGEVVRSQPSAVDKRSVSLLKAPACKKRSSDRYSRFRNLE